MTDGEGICGINQAPAYPNLLMQPKPFEFWSIVGCMTWVLFIVMPFAWCKMSQALKEGYDHPSMTPFMRTLVFETVFFGFCWLFYAVSVTSSFTNYQFKQIVVFGFYTTLHTTFLSLHNCLAIKSKAQLEMLYKHTGMSRCPKYTFGVLLFGVWITVFIICIFQMAGLNAWNSYYAFTIIHLEAMDTWAQILLYLCCAVVQACKICQFFSTTEKKYLKPFAWCGFVFSIVIFCLFVLHIVSLIWFPGRDVLAWLQVVTLAWSSVLMLPLLHFMVIRHKKFVPTSQEINERQSEVSR